MADGASLIYALVVEEEATAQESHNLLLLIVAIYTYLFTKANYGWFSMVQPWHWH